MSVVHTASVKHLPRVQLTQGDPATADELRPVPAHPGHDRPWLRFARRPGQSRTHEAALVLLMTVQQRLATPRQMLEGQRADARSPPLVASSRVLLEVQVDGVQSLRAEHDFRANVPGSRT